MNSDVVTLQNIADTLKEEPMASQRLLAENAGMSIGLIFGALLQEWRLKRAFEVQENSCENCKHGDLDWDEEPCDSCALGHSNWEAME